jgi:hypothetical protein
VTTRRQDSHLVAFANWAPRELDGFRHVSFEVQPERATVGEGGDLPLEIPGKSGLSIP